MTNKATNIEKLLWSQVPVPQTNVSVYEALYGRRMAWKFKDTPVPREALDRMLATAIWAPNHRLTEPWRFFVMEKGTPLRKRIADLVYDGLMAEWDDARRAEPYRTKILAPPIAIYVYCVQGSDEFVTKENYAATSIAMQNIALSGHAEGLSVNWDTGRVTRVPGLAQVLGTEPDWDILAMMAIGYPDEESKSSRTPVTQFVRWG